MDRVADLTYSYACGVSITEAMAGIDTDTIIPLTGNSMLTYNLFAYCWNNPVNMSDESGNIPFFVVRALVGAVAKGCVFWESLL